MNCNQCGAEIKEGNITCPECGAYVNSANQLNGYGQNMQAAPQTQLGMRWFKFIIWVQLFLNALLNVVSAYRIFTGTQYKDGSYNITKYIYMFYPSLETADKLYAFSLIFLAVFAIVTRFLLAGYKKIAPFCYHGVIGCNIVFAVVYLCKAASIMDMSVGEVMTSNYKIQLLVSIILLAVNIIYFNKRKHLFVK